MFELAAQLAPGLLTNIVTIGPRACRGASPWLGGWCRFPEKRELIPQTDGPPQTGNTTALFQAGLYSQTKHFLCDCMCPVFRHALTQALRFQVERHVQRSWALLSLDDLWRRFEPVSVIAIAQRSRKSRSLFESRVPGGQGRHGAMGNALGTGVRLHDLLESAGLRAGAIDVDGLRAAKTWRRGCPP
ncbi:MAG: putative cytochrome dehydrogenase-related protein [Candidatus Solibacter sp.]|nr:putative cytochrome dehydrogenase-related protein [Candidatus Solibacter sp.]